MPSFLESMLGSAMSPSAGFNYGAAAAGSRYPATQGGYNTGDANTLSSVIAQMRADADREYQLNKDRLDNDYRVALMNARTSRDVQRANERYQEGQMQLARERLQFDREVQQQEFGLKQATLGYNLLGTLAQLRGPADYFQSANYARGVANTPGSSAFLTALQSNARLPGFGAQQGAPEGETGNTLLAKLGGTYQAGAGGTTNASGQSAIAPGNVVNGTVLSASSTPMSGAASNDARLAQIHGIGQRGAHKLASGTLEQLSPDEYDLLMSGLEAPDANGNAFSARSFLNQYNQSRVGQGFAASRAA